ncbi:erythromycin resistance leader peptide [Staphylococcus aureus]
MDILSIFVISTVSYQPNKK